MLKPIAAGLLCVGFVTLGVTASRGEEEDGRLDLIVVEEAEKPAADAVKKPEPAGGNVFEIRIGEDGNATFTGKGEKKDAEGGEGGEGIQVIIQNEDGKTAQKIEGKPRAIRAEGRARFTLPAIDPETRDALGKMVAGLKDETKRLDADGKKEEAEKKLQSIRALEQLLNPGPRWGAMSLQPGAQGGGVNFIVRTAENGEESKETKRLAERMQKLQEQASKLREGDHEAREKLQRLSAELHKAVVEHQRQKVVAAPGANPYVPGAPGTPLAPGTPMLPGQPVNLPPGGWIGAPANVFWMAEGNPAVTMLTRKAAALSEASAKLKEAGLEQQSHDLHEQAEKLKAQAEKLRSQAPAQAGMGPWGAGGFAGGPPMQLQHSIHELQEQVQQLRKEIGELRELLQRRP